MRHLIDRGDLIRGDAGDWITQSTGVEVSLPDSIQALLNARIDRLDEDTRRTLQVASVIGRQFMRSPLAALVDKPQRLDQQLLDLQRMELIREVSRVPEPGYRFDHTLTQEVVYHNILQKERRAMHLRVAETIETLREGSLPAVAPVLAHHFLEGHAPERALPHLLAAGRSALRLHATTEAIAFYERALPIARDLPDGGERLLEIYTRRGRALELESRFVEAKETYEALEALGKERQEAALELEGIIALGKLHATVTPFFDVARARELMERAMALAEASPCTVLTSMGKKVITTTTAALDGQSKPNHMTRIGAMPMTGSADTKLPSGSRPRCRKGERSIRIATMNPEPQPST